MNKNPKKLITFFITLLLVISAIIIIMLIYLNKETNNQGQKYSEDMGGSLLDEYVNADENVLSKNAYFDINACITQYLNILNINGSSYYGYNENGEYALIVDENAIKQNIYDMLSEVYISKNNVTLDNIYEYVKTKNVQTLYVPLEIWALQSGNIQSFLIHGLVENLQLEVVDEIFAVVNIDKVNNVFSIEPIYGEYNTIADIEIKELENKININKNNTLTSSAVSNENIIKDYINIYKRLALGNPEKIYNMLDEEYKKIRFQDLEEFKKYINDNRKQILGIRVEKYQATKVDDYTQYECIDQNGKYYIFRENELLKYTVLLDNYTIPTKDFGEEYNSSSDPEKVVLNIKRFFMGIDDKNYGYSYNVLSESFRNNKYPTKNDFINYAKQTFFERNEIEYISYEKENGLYIYKIKVTDGTGNSQEARELNIILKLNSGTDFELSFGEN